LCDAPRVLAVSLHRHELESIAHVPGFQQFDRQTCLLPAYSHCESGPAFNPIHAISKPRPLHQAVKASGSLATFASQTIRPVASTTQMLELSSDTSIPP
jgi:hypothetical protein